MLGKKEILEVNQTSTHLLGRKCKLNQNSKIKNIKIRMIVKEKYVMGKIN
jgi:hypothetical protein